MAEDGSISCCRPLNYRTAKTGGAVNGSAFAPLILNVDRLGRVCYFYLLLIIDKFKHVLNSHMEHFRNVHSQFKGWIISSVFQMDDCFPSCADKLGQLALLIPRLLPIFFDFGYKHD